MSVRVGSFVGSRCTTTPRSALLAQFADPEMSYRVGGGSELPSRCIFAGCATNQTCTSLLCANRFTLPRSWLTYSVSREVRLKVFSKKRVLKIPEKRFRNFQFSGLFFGDCA